MNTLDPVFFSQNIRSGYEQRLERHANKGQEAVEIDVGIFELIRDSHQVVHNRGKALSYLAGKRKEGPERAPRPEPHKYLCTTELMSVGVKQGAGLGRGLVGPGAGADFQQARQQQLLLHQQRQQ